jgi:predicted nucleic acid-binding protein
MAQANYVTLALDSGAIIAAEKDQRVEAVIQKWLREGATLLIAAPTLAEVLRGGPMDAIVNRLVKAVGNTIATSESIGRQAGLLLGAKTSRATVDALIVATVESCGATDILTTDARDIALLSGGSLHVIGI